MTDREARSEQQERLELADQPPEDDPRPWRDADPDQSRQPDGIGHLVAPPDAAPLIEDRAGEAGD
ncbi:hypothetical protein [Actinophytocola sp.]|uniref:hypothetical protein n=1 Tax=Actinophytocola sp. TaxID=1872138 RepID=UPI00389A79D7